MEEEEKEVEVVEVEEVEEVEVEEVEEVEEVRWRRCPPPIVEVLPLPPWRAMSGADRVLGI